MNGIKKLYMSSKGVLSLLIFFGSLAALFYGKLDSLAFSAIVSTVAIIYNYTRYRSDQLGIGSSQQ